MPGTGKHMKSWFESVLGSHLLRAERRVAGELLGHCFGHYLLQYGVWGGRTHFLDCARTRYRFLAGGGATDLPVDVRVSAQPLPFASDSVDVIVLPHAMEFESSPHALLRETERVLRGEGRLLVLGFNPRGICGLRKPFSRRQFPWNGQWISERRLRDWLRLLDMDILAVRHYFFRPPLQFDALLKRSRWLDRAGSRLPVLACGYALLACKRLYGVNPLRIEPRRQRGLTPTLAGPAIRNIP